MDRIFTMVAGRIAAWTGQPSAFIVASLIIIAWIVTGPLFDYSDTWQLVINTATTVVTFLMVFRIQNSQNRDAAAIQCKLDELIRAVDDARGEFIGIEHLPDGDIQKIRDALEADSRKEGERTGDKPRRHDSVSRLLRRR